MFNLWNANTLTANPICSFDPVGPPIGFALYHNSASANDNVSGEDGQGFDLGRGWSTSYSGRLVFNSGSSTTVIEDDGTQNTYSLVSGFWTPPTGVHDRLSYDNATDPNHPVWILTRPSQQKRVFNAAGLLIEERDSIGNAAKIIRDPGNDDRITAIRSAAHGLPNGGGGTLTHQITLGYTSDQLTSITDVLGRAWTLEYYSAGSDTGRLRYLHYPHSDIAASFMEFDYHPSSGRINGLHQRRESSENDVFWEYGYSAGILQELIDPGQGAPDPNNPYSTGQHGFTVIGGATTYRREVTDRRGELWSHVFNSSGNRIKTIDPVSEEREFAYDGDRNVTAYTDELEHAWTYTYGPVGNVETVTSPLDTDPNHPQTWTLDWNAVGAAGVTNFYQLTKITSPAGKWVEYEYAGNDLEEPLSTLPIRIIQLADGCGNPNNVTELQYYTGATSEAHAYGQLWRATDANGVITQFEYDRWGYLAWLTEGLFFSSTTGTAGCIPVEGGPGGAAGPMPGGGPNDHPGFRAPTRNWRRSRCSI